MISHGKCKVIAPINWKMIVFGHDLLLLHQGSKLTLASRQIASWNFDLP